MFGQGTKRAAVMFVGEQPGDKEDLAGKPFVGPSGRLLDEGLAAAGIDRSAAYVTNLVKHFKWEPKGKRRIHRKPNADEIMACRPWLDAELDRVDPQIVVCLGATAAKALLGSSFRVTKERGTFRDTGSRLLTATLHPSAILRIPDSADRLAEQRGFFDDLRRVAERL